MTKSDVNRRHFNHASLVSLLAAATAALRRCKEASESIIAQ